jgi:hypothetical protein
VSTAAEKKLKVVIHVNEQPVKLAEHRVTGLEIKQAAIDQGVEIELDFILVEELKHGETRVIGDDDPVTVTKRSRFGANADDDNS